MLLLLVCAVFVFVEECVMCEVLLFLVALPVLFLLFVSAFGFAAWLCCFWACTVLPYVLKNMLCVMSCCFAEVVFVCLFVLLCCSLDLLYLSLCVCFKLVC